MGAQVQLWAVGFTSSHEGILCLPSPHLGCTGPEDVPFLNAHKGLASTEAWLIRGAESMPNHKELKPLGSCSL